VIVAIVQARINSTRLPGKVLLDLAGKPILAHMIERLRRSRRIEKILVATTTGDRDDPIALLCTSLGAECFRGSEIDVLNRYYRAAIHAGASTIIRLTSDCPLIDPEIVDAAVALHETSKPKADYVVSEGFPHGFDVEVFTFDALERSWREDHDAATREHVTPYIIRHPDVFRIVRLICPDSLPPLRLTVDTLDDYNLVFKIYRELGHRPFGWREVVDLLSERRDWLRLNAHVRQQQIHPKHDDPHRKS
jgi:spore coat polysaccharide biosynthesis protein SpsF